MNESEMNNSFGFTMKLDDDAMMKLLEESVMDDSDVASEICEGNKVKQECVNKLVDDCLLKMI